MNQIYISLLILCHAYFDCRSVLQFTLSIRFESFPLFISVIVALTSLRGVSYAG